jgi:hypothetical protein
MKILNKILMKILLKVKNQLIMSKNLIKLVNLYKMEIV